MTKAIRSGRMCLTDRMTVISKYVAGYHQDIKNDQILDFGAGRRAAQTRLLKEQGFDVVAYDLPENTVAGTHLVGGLVGKYKLVMGSNILNVQPNLQSIENVAIKIRGLLTKNGVALFNYPTSPRYGGLSSSQVDGVLLKIFQFVKKLDKKYVGNNIVWECK